MRFPFFRRSPRGSALAGGGAPASFVLTAAAAPEGLGGLRVDPPLTRGALSVYPLRRREPAGRRGRGGGHRAEPRFIPLGWALEQGWARLHETDGLREIEVENLVGTDLFVQAGEVVAGSWREWVLGTDLIIPRRERARRIGLRAFCLQPGYFHDNQAVSAAFRQVWAGADEGAAGAGASAGGAEGAAGWAGAASEPPAGAAGCLFAIGGQVRAAHVYGSEALFAALWPKLVAAAEEEAVAAAGGAAPAKGGPGTVPASPPAPEAVRDWLQRLTGRLAEASMTQIRLTPRVLLALRETPEGVFVLDTLDAGQGLRCVHRFLVTPPGAAGAATATAGALR